MKISTPIIHTLQLATLPIMDDPHLFLSLQTTERWKSFVETRKHWLTLLGLVLN